MEEKSVSEVEYVCSFISVNVIVREREGMRVCMSGCDVCVCCGWERVCANVMCACVVCERECVQMWFWTTEIERDLVCLCMWVWCVCVCAWKRVNVIVNKRECVCVWVSLCVSQCMCVCVLMCLLCLKVDLIVAFYFATFHLRVSGLK